MLKYTESSHKVYFFTVADYIWCANNNATKILLSLLLDIGLYDIVRLGSEKQLMS